MRSLFLSQTHNAMRSQFAIQALEGLKLFFEFAQLPNIACKAHNGAQAYAGRTRAALHRAGCGRRACAHKCQQSFMCSANCLGAASSALDKNSHPIVGKKTLNCRYPRTCSLYNKERNFCSNAATSGYFGSSKYPSLPESPNFSRFDKPSL